MMPIIVGTGTISTQATIAATKQAKLFGADAALIVTPYYVKPTQGGLLNHFTQIADAVELPIVLYNVPGRTGVDMSIETTVALSRHPMIQGLKDATGDNGRAAPLRAVCGDDFRLYSGEDGMARDYVLQGGDGAISVTANVAPAGVAKVMAAANARDRSAAEAADAPLQALHRDLFCEANPIPVKWALAKMGRMQGGIRSPLVPLGIDFHGRVEAALSNAKLIAGAAGASSSFGWPSRQLLLQGHLFDQGLINQALEIIEKRGGDFEIVSFSATPNDQRTEFNFRRTSSITLKIFGVDGAALDDITARLQSLVDVLESAEGVLTTIPEPAASRTVPRSHRQNNLTNACCGRDAQIEISFTAYERHTYGLDGRGSQDTTERQRAPSAAQHACATLITSAKMPAAVTAAPAPGPWTTRGCGA